MSNVHKQIAALFQAAHEHGEALKQLHKMVAAQTEPFRNMALVAAVLQEKGMVTNNELTEMLAKLRAEHKATQSTDGKVSSELPNTGSDASGSGNGNGGIPQGEGSSGVAPEPADGPAKDNPGSAALTLVAP